MVHRYLLLVAGLLLGACAGYAQSGWVLQNPLPTPHDLTDVQHTSANTFIAVGLAGTIVKTTDGGNTWTQQTSGVTNWLQGVSFLDANIGTAVGGDGTIIRTIDGGTTWTRQESGTTKPLWGVSFTGSNTGIVVG
ncbi:MAG: hypothetical protein H7X70_06415, partial [Candidatus Kapabacteria bacterium]|nr:hypothetical protein [Candidatus Kapabacteria bacterium]